MRKGRVDFVSNSDFIRKLSSETGYSYSFTQRNTKLLLKALSNRVSEYDCPAFYFPKFGVMYLKIPLITKFINTSLRRNRRLKSSQNKLEKLGNMVYNFENKIVPKLGPGLDLHYKESKIEWFFSKLRDKGFTSSKVELERRQNEEYEKSR